MSYAIAMRWRNGRGSTDAVESSRGVKVSFISRNGVLGGWPNPLPPRRVLGKNANRGLLNSSTLSQTFAFSSSTYFFLPVSRIGKLDPIRSAYYNMQTVSKSRIVVTQLLILKEKYHFVEILFNVKRINQNFLICCMLVYTLIKNCSMYSRVTIHTVVFFSNSLCIELIDFPFVSRNGRNLRCS